MRERSLNMSMQWQAVVQEVWQQTTDPDMQ